MKRVFYLNGVSIVNMRLHFEQHSPFSADSYSFDLLIAGQLQLFPKTFPTLAHLD